MGLFGNSAATASAAAAAAAAPMEKQQQQQAEIDELSRIIAGAPDDTARVAETKKFIASNRRHTYVDVAWGVAAYSFSGLQHVHGQSTALTLLSMWAAGTTFLVNAATRQVLTQASLATLDDESSQSTSAKGSAKAAGIETDAVSSLLANAGTVRSASAAAAKVQDGNAVHSGSSAEPKDDDKAKRQLLSIASASDFDSQRRNVFQLEAVGSWIWMLAALQQFRVHKRLKWCGYSSWMGLGCAIYYTFRHMYNVLVL